MSDLALVSVSQPETVPELEQQSFFFCEAIFFFYACGCRTRAPVFCCKPDPNVFPRNINSNNSNPCRHETPSIIIANLPHACGARLGTTEACSAEDPGMRAFVREVDTAERLDLAILGGFSRDEIDTALPEWVEGSFTTEQIAMRSLMGMQSESPFFSPSVASFVPTTMVCTPAPAQPGMGAREGQGSAIGQLGNTAKENIVDAERYGGGFWVGEGEKGEYEKIDGYHEEPGRARCLTDRSWGEDAPFTPAASTSSHITEVEDFFDIELSPIPEYAPSTSSISTAEDTLKPEGPATAIPAADVAGSYDDLMVFYLDDSKAEAARQAAKKSGWGVKSFLGKIW